MSMTEWAEEEIRIACERKCAAMEKEDSDLSKMELEYAKSCYQSALKAYKSLCGDGHSGMSFNITAGILKRLCSGYPLTPIEDVEEVWNLVHETPTTMEYQCRRMYSLFKTVHKEDGSVYYHDNDRFICVDPNGATYTNNFINRQLSKLYPLTMPYMPNGKFLVKAFDFATNANPGEFDTILIRSVKEPNGQEVLLNLCYKETKNGFEQIQLAEYEERYKAFLASAEAQAKVKRATEANTGTSNDPAETI